MKVIDPRSSKQLTAGSKRYKKGGYKPYWGPSPARHIYGMDVRAFPLKFDPPIVAEWRRW